MVDIDHRKIVFLYFRIRNRLSAYCNRIKLSTIGVKYGKNCMIQGHLYITLFPSAQLTIGDNLHYSSGWNINALCANRCGSIYATENAKNQNGNNCGMSSSILWSHKSIIIGNNVKLGGNSIIIDTDSHNLNRLKRRNGYSDTVEAQSVCIEDDVLIGMNSVILKGVTIGARSIIGANSVVTKNIPPDCIAAGNPARVIKYLKN